VLSFGVLAERLRSRLWPIPALAAALALLLGVAASAIRAPAGSSPIGADPASARGILEVLAGSSLTVVALVLSLQVVALQLAASQYSPRLLRTYARDWVVQVSLAVLIATFVFSITTLALFGASQETPIASIVIGLLMGLGSVAALVGVVAHIVTSLRVETSMAALHEDAAAVIAEVYGTAGCPAEPGVSGDGSPFTAPRAGFVQAVDADRLAGWAQSHDTVVRLDVRPGEHVLTDQPLGVVLGSTDPDASLPDAVLIGHERTPDADPGFGLLQLVDIALRALSPGVNDPTTARHAIGHLTSLLLEVAANGAQTVRCTMDHQGVGRVRQPLPGLDELVPDTCLPLARAGGRDPVVLIAILRLVGAVAAAAPDAQRAAVLDVGRYVERTATRELADPDDRAAVRRALVAARSTAAGS
jgi:uncharacterized membrane protein